MIARALILSLALSAAAVAASAQPIRGAVVASSDEAISAPRGVKTGDPDRRVCKLMKATGSRLARAKVCMTAREWAETQTEQQSDLDRKQRPRPEGVAAPGRGGGGAAFRASFFPS